MHSGLTLLEAMIISCSHKSGFIAMAESQGRVPSVSDIRMAMGISWAACKPASYCPFCLSSPGVRLDFGSKSKAFCHASMLNLLSTKACVCYEFHGRFRYENAAHVMGCSKSRPRFGIAGVKLDGLKESWSITFLIEVRGQRTFLESSIAC